jgi:nicotinamidase-related amidase
MPDIDYAKTALLVMDYQTGILGMLPESEALLDRAARAIDHVRGQGGQVGYVRVAFKDSDIDALPPSSPMAARVGTLGDQMHDKSPATQIHERIAPANGDIVVRKTRVGAFSTTDLEKQLHAKAIDTLILAGVSTSGVVLSTVRDAADRDYRLLVLADACADRDGEVHDVLLGKVFPRQATVITVADLIEG